MPPAEKRRLTGDASGDDPVSPTVARYDVRLAAAIYQYPGDAALHLFVASHG